PPDGHRAGDQDARGQRQRPAALHQLASPYPSGPLRRLGSRPGLHVGLGGQLVHGLAQLLPCLLDLLLYLFSGHRCVLSLISSISALTPATACSGPGGAASARRRLPSSAAQPAAPSRAAPTISAAS